MTTSTEPETCQRCGHENACWSAPSPLWNAVVRGNDINGEPLFGDMLCAACFMALAEKAGIASLFRVTAEQVNVPLQLITPSGRVWDDQQGLWTAPTEPELLTPLPATAGICAYDSDECTVTLALDSRAEVESMLAKLPGKNRVRLCDDEAPADRIQTLEAALAAEREACAKVCDAGRALVAKLDECQPHIEAATMFQFTHGIEYTGPQYGEELVALRAAIRARSIQDRVSDD